VYKGMSELRR